ncbi:MAG: hypothetical protein IPN39_05215 [Chitinophagaceae bacterium]|nr:hypothetical protein [Chitinophagaceae bacterium]
MKLNRNIKIFINYFLGSATVYMAAAVYLQGNNNQPDFYCLAKDPVNLLPVLCYGNLGGLLKG